MRGIAFGAMAFVDGSLAIQNFNRMERPAEHPNSNIGRPKKICEKSLASWSAVAVTPLWHAVVLSIRKSSGVRKRRLSVHRDCHRAPGRKRGIEGFVTPNDTGQQLALWPGVCYQTLHLRAFESGTNEYPTKS